MADKVTKSLDEIIKETKPLRGAGGPNRRGGLNRRGGRGGGAGRFNRNRGGAVAAPGFRRQQQNGGSVQKRRSGGLSPNKTAAINGKWSHDLFQNGAGGAGGGSAKLIVSNLDFGVNDSDIDNLFQEFGRLKKAAVHYDRTGRSLGTAEVFFDRRSDAIRAMNHYNGVSLDGRPMSIEVIGSSPVKPAGNPVQRGGGAGGPRPSNRGNGGFRRGGGGGNRGGNRGGARGNRQPKPVKTAADLDADLDAHNAKMQTD